MKKQLIILLFVLIVPNKSFSQFTPGARQIALAHSDISFASESFNIFNNPAGLSNLSNREVALFYSPELFGLREIKTASGSFAQPTKIGTFSTGFIFYGFDLYKETKIAVGYSYKLSSNFSLGFTSLYNNISIQNYGAKGFITINAGGTADLTKKIKIGFVFENLTRESAGNEPNQIPVTYSTGIGYRAVDELTLFLSVKKELNYNPSFRLGAEYFLSEFIPLRIGITNEPDSYSGGIGVLYEFMQFDYAFISHPDLGFNHQFGLVIRF